MSATQQEQTALCICVRDAAELIVDELRDLDFAQVSAYARGVKHALSSAAERLDVAHERLDLCQIDGALGERFRRLFPAKNQFRSRGLNPVVNAVRDKRIAMFDEYVLANYATELRPWRKKLEKLGRQDRPSDDPFWSELQVVQRELDAIQQLNHQLLSDKIWWEEHYRRMKAADLAAKNAESAKAADSVSSQTLAPHVTSCNP
jgi:hypothetical protein